MVLRSQGIVSTMSILVALGLATQPGSAPAQQCDDLCRHRFEFHTCGTSKCMKYLHPTCLLCSFPLGKAACVDNNDALTGPCAPNNQKPNVIFYYGITMPDCDCGKTLVNVQGTCDATFMGSQDIPFTYHCGG